MSKLKILTIVGARPQIIKAAAISRAIDDHFSEQVEEYILHTGQHYDNNMSAVFFEQLGIPKPDFQLDHIATRHALQTGLMMEGIEKVLQENQFDMVIVYGDTNSTLAGTLAASKLIIPVAHVEAGLRSYDMDMPEEQNRIVSDHLSSLLFAPTQTAMDNLKHEGLTDSPAVFKNYYQRRAVLSGDVMYDNSMYFAQIAEQDSMIFHELDLERENFILATIHRPSNTDNENNLCEILKALLSIAATEKTPIVFPVHPRTRKMIECQLAADVRSELYNSAYIKIIEPASFFDIIMLEKYAKLVVTDSGGVQKEAYFYQTPSVIVREQTEWVEIVESGAAVLAKPECESILKSYSEIVNRQVEFKPFFGDGHAAEKIVNEIINYLS